VNDPIRLVIADDHYFFLEGIKTVIGRSFPDIRIVGCAANGREACRLVTELGPDVVLMDAKMPVMDGVDATREIRAREPTLPILILTTFDERRLIRDALNAGASGYLLKDTRVEEIIEAVRSSFSGNVQISPKAADSLANDYTDTDIERELQNTAEYLVLTTRQQRVLSLAARGLDNAEIADQLFISEKTVRNHISSIYHTLEIKNRSQLILWALSHGLQ
jgi:DNA-binding NarL/FixJ family response regulator